MQSTTMQLPINSPEQTQFQSDKYYLMNQTNYTVSQLDIAKCRLQSYPTDYPGLSRISLDLSRISPG